MERINAYTTPNADGGFTFDAEGMTVDLVTMIKGSGANKEEFLKFVGDIYDEVKITVTIPSKHKH